jgi:hypothetical protein
MTLPSEHVTTPTTFTTVLTSRSDTVNPILKGAADTVPSRVYEDPNTSRKNTTLEIVAVPPALVTSTKLVSEFL